MENYTKTNRVKYTEQINLMLTPEEKDSLVRIAKNLRGTNSQVLRLALQEFIKNRGIQNATAN